MASNTTEQASAGTDNKKAAIGCLGLLFIGYVIISLGGKSSSAPSEASGDFSRCISFDNCKLNCNNVPVRYESELVCVLPGDVRDGPYVSWHSNGFMKTQGVYSNGRKTGVWKEWSNNGSLLSEINQDTGQSIITSNSASSNSIPNSNTDHKTQPRRAIYSELLAIFDKADRESKSIYKTDLVKELAIGDSLYLKSNTVVLPTAPWSNPSTIQESLAKTNLIAHSAVEAGARVTVLDRYVIKDGYGDGVDKVHYKVNAVINGRNVATGWIVDIALIGQVPSVDDQLAKQNELYGKLEKKYIGELKRKHSLTDVDIDSIIDEGGRNNWGAQ